MDSVKSINLFETKKGYRVPDYLLNDFFYQFVNNFLALLLFCEINVFDNLGFFFGILLYREVLKL